MSTQSFNIFFDFLKQFFHGSVNANIYFISFSKCSIFRSKNFNSFCFMCLTVMYSARHSIQSILSLQIHWAQGAFFLFLYSLFLIDIWLSFYMTLNFVFNRISAKRLPSTLISSVENCCLAPILLLLRSSNHFHSFDTKKYYIIIERFA